MVMTKNQKSVKPQAVYSASQRFIMTTPRKLRRSADLIRGKNLRDAVSILRFSGLRASELVLKKLNEAYYNALQVKAYPVEQMLVHEIRVDEGPTHTRFKPRAQGRMYKRLRRTSHIFISIAVTQPEIKESV
jgi:large subunit ribosomal protein L22